MAPVSPHPADLFEAETPELARALALQADRAVALRFMPEARRVHWFTHDAPPPDPRPLDVQFWEVSIWDVDPASAAPRIEAQRFKEGKMRDLLFASFFKRFALREPSSPIFDPPPREWPRTDDPTPDVMQDLRLAFGPDGSIK